MCQYIGFPMLAAGTGNRPSPQKQIIEIIEIYETDVMSHPL